MPRRDILASQHTVVMISEMIHTASLIHDDVIDGAETRRNKTSVNKLFGDKLCVLAGDYILSCASQALAKLGNPEVVKLLAQVVEDLVRGIEALCYMHVCTAVATALQGMGINILDLPSLKEGLQISFLFFCLVTPG